MKTVFLWPIERVDAAGEPSPAGDFIKLGLRRPGEVSAICIDSLDAAALADGLQRLISGRAPGGELAALACETCRKPIDAGAHAYQAKPGGGRCLICEACAPTVAEEVADIIRRLSLSGGSPLPGFERRAEALAWVNRVRGMYHPQAKRLAPIVPLALPPLEADLFFKDPPATAREVTEEAPHD